MTLPLDPFDLICIFWLGPLLAICAQNGITIGINSREILRFLNLGLKLPIYANLGAFGAYFLRVSLPVILTPRGTFLRADIYMWTEPCDSTGVEFSY